MKSAFRSVAVAAIVAVCSAAPTSAQQPAPASPTSVRYVLDGAHTYIGFSARHMLVTRVRGKFNEFEGEILLDTADITRSVANVTIQTASVDTDNDRRDNHLRSEDFFEAERFPTITFRGTGVARRGDQLFLVGDLTIRDVTRPVEIPFELNGPVGAPGEQRIGAEGELTVDRFDYGLKWDRAVETGGLVVSREVTLELSVEARQPRAG